MIGEGQEGVGYVKEVECVFEDEARVAQTMDEALLPTIC